MHKIKVNNYDIEPMLVEAGTAGSYGIETLSFEFDSSWDGLKKSVVFFTEEESIIKISLDADEPVPVPEEMSLYGGDFGFALVGTAKGVQKVSVTGTLRVMKTLSMELFEKPIDKVSSAFSEFLLLYEELLATTERMKIELRFNETANTVEWRYSGTDEWFELASLAAFNAEKRIDNGAVPSPESHFLPKCTSVVYIDDDGDDSNDGVTPATPVKSPETAASKLPHDGGTVCIVSTYTCDSGIRLYHTGPVLITGLSPDSLLNCSAVTLLSDFSFSSLTIKPLRNYTFFNAGGHRLGMLSGLTILPPDTDEKILLGIRGGGDHEVEASPSGEKAHVAIFSGSYSNVFSGGRADMHRDSVIEYHGGSAEHFRMGNDGSVGQFYGTSYFLNDLNVKNLGNAPLDGDCAEVYCFPGGYVTYESVRGFILYTPGYARISDGSRSYSAQTGVIDVSSSSTVRHFLEWDFTKTRKCRAVLPRDIELTVIGGTACDTGTLVVSGGGLLKNFPTEGLSRIGKVEYTVTVRDSGELTFSACNL